MGKKLKLNVMTLNNVSLINSKLVRLGGIQENKCATAKDIP